MKITSDVDLIGIRAQAEEQNVLLPILMRNNYSEHPYNAFMRTVTGISYVRTYKNASISDADAQKIRMQQSAQEYLYHYCKNRSEQRITAILVLSAIIFALFIGFAIKWTVQHEHMSIFIEHFTNWAWAMHTLFYIALWVSLMIAFQTRVLYYVLGIFITTIAGVATTVCTLVLINIGLLEQYWLNFGDESSYSYTTVSYFLDTFSPFNPESSQAFDVNDRVWSVLVGSELYHTFPVVFWMLTVVVFDEQLKESFIVLYSGYNKWQTFCIKLVLTFAPFFVMLSYLLFYDPLAVYHAKGPLYPAIVLGAGICGVVNYVLLKKYFPYPVSSEFLHRHRHEHHDPMLTNASIEQMTVSRPYTVELYPVGRVKK